MKTLYYAHSLITYATDKEKNELAIIKRVFPEYKIINPEEIPYTGMNNCLIRVRSCTILVYSEYKYHIGKGVYLEIQEAKSAGLPIFCIRDHKVLEYESSRVNNQNDWKVEHAITYVGREVTTHYGRQVS